MVSSMLPSVIAYSKMAVSVGFKQYSLWSLAHACELSVTNCDKVELFSYNT